jgi:hypothetical protein
MASDGEGGLFEGLPDQAAPERAGGGLPRLRFAERDQIAWRPVSLDGLLADDHLVRLVSGSTLRNFRPPLRRWAADPAIRRRPSGFCWRFGCMPQWKGLAARARWLVACCLWSASPDRHAGFAGRWPTATIADW